MESWPLRRFSIILFFGLLPLWLAIAAVYYGSLAENLNRDYWIAAPWLIFFSIPFCGVTILITALVLRAKSIYESTPGFHPEKFAAARHSFAKPTIVIIASCGVIAFFMAFSNVLDRIF